jgi:hypothetical protein
MHHLAVARPHCSSPRTPAGALVLIVLVAVDPAGAVDEKKPTKEGRAPVAKSLAQPGMLLAREAPGKSWQALGPQDTVHSRDLLLALPGSRAGLRSNNGAVQLLLWGNLPQLSLNPVLESAVALHESSDQDLGFTLDRGRVVVSNQRDKGAARVRVRVRDQSWELNLEEPGAAVALEHYGRWPRGVPFNPDPKSADQPTAALVLLVLKGNVSLRAGGVQRALGAPPGPAYFHWDSVGGPDPGPQRLDRLPDWAEAKSTPEAKALQEVLERFSKQVKERPVTDVLALVLAGATGDSDTARASLKRALAVTGWGALDDLGRLTAALADEKQGEVRALAIEALRHWIGRAPGNDVALYQHLNSDQKYSPAQAATVLNLLHSFGDQELARPETYDALLAYLRHERLPIRELARWHLVRLVPDGKKVVFDPAAAAAEREKGFREWQKLVEETLKRQKPR